MRLEPRIWLSNALPRIGLECGLECRGWVECHACSNNAENSLLEFEKARLTLVPALLSIALDGKAPTCRRSSVSAPFGVPKLGLRSKFILRHRAPDLIILQTIIECSSGKNIEACLEGGPFEEGLSTARAIFGVFHLLSLAQQMYH